MPERRPGWRAAHGDGRSPAAQSPEEGATSSSRRGVVGEASSGTIICAVDESEGAEAAVQAARRLAERFEARILLVAVAGGVAAGDHRSLSARQARAGATRRLERIASADDASQEQYRIAEGDPAEAVATIAAEEAADLIVVGARRGRFGRTLRSAFAVELAGTASCPVLLAPPEAHLGTT